MKKSVVITTIFDPSAAVKKFAASPDTELIVIGDRKTPKLWSCEGAHYFSIADQKDLGLSITEFLPFDHYCRKMIGYLVAIQRSAKIIIDTDDDNFPKKNWKVKAFEDVYTVVDQNIGFVNIYKWFTDRHIWPRGLPLGFIKADVDFEAICDRRGCKVGIWQGLADGDPDVDAIYRLTNKDFCHFESREPIVLSPGTVSPFNSQNTAFRKELFALLYLPASVTFRFTDILRGLVAQPIMWSAGYQLGFTEPTVVQERNPHDLMRDFEAEIPMFLEGEKVVSIVADVVEEGASVEDNLRSAYAALRDEEIVEPQETNILEAWLRDLEACQSK